MELLLQWKSNKYYTFWVCLGSLTYPACNAHAPYYHLWPARLYINLSHYLTNGKISKKKMLFNMKCVIRFSLLHLSETFLILRINERGMIKMHIDLHVKYHYSCQILMKLEFSQQILKKVHKHQISCNPVQWKPKCSMRADGKT